MQVSIPSGGRTTVEGDEGNDLQKNSRVAITVALLANRNNSLKLYASTGVSTRIGSDFDTIGLAWQYRSGAADFSAYTKIIEKVFIFVI